MPSSNRNESPHKKNFSLLSLKTKDDEVIVERLKILEKTSKDSIFLVEEFEREVKEFIKKNLRNLGDENSQKNYDKIEIRVNDLVELTNETSKTQTSVIKEARKSFINICLDFEKTKEYLEREERSNKELINFSEKFKNFTDEVSKNLDYLKKTNNYLWRIIKRIEELEKKALEELEEKKKRDQIKEKVFFQVLENSEKKFFKITENQTSKLDEIIKDKNYSKKTDKPTNSRIENLHPFFFNKEIIEKKFIFLFIFFQIFQLFYLICLSFQRIFIFFKKFSGKSRLIYKLKKNKNNWER